MDVLVVGAGPVAIEYTRILLALGHTAVVVGRGAVGCQSFQEATGVAAQPGGLEAYPKSSAFPDHAIVAVSETQLGIVTELLAARGVRHILVEKPGGASVEEICRLAELSERSAVHIYVGYNRRFHASTLRAQEIIREDGGVTSFHFEFTEWSHRIEPLVKEPGVKQAWFLHNSSHVVDLAFHLAGWPEELVSYQAGSLSWHPYARYAGAGRTKSGALFSYFADWQAPGRWGVEILTRAHRLIFRPLEKLQVQKLGSINVEQLQIDDSLDVAYKPGFYKQVEAFFNEPQLLMTLQTQAEHLNTFAQMHPGL